MDLASLDAFSYRLRAGQTREIELVTSVRVEARSLREEITGGYYDDAQLSRFWELVERSPLQLMTSNPELSQRAGLGQRFFSTVAIDRRRPKLANMLRALTAIIEVADERLADIETASGSPAEWIVNPLLADPKALRELEDQLLQLIKYLRHSNSLSDDQIIDQHWRKSLIDLLETTLAILKAPMIERSIFRRTGSSLAAAGQAMASHTSAGFFGAVGGAVATVLLQIANLD